MWLEVKNTCKDKGTQQIILVEYIVVCSYDL